jgi:hypothetical protein
MKDLTTTILSCLLVAVIFISPVRGVTATWDEALTVAENWIVKVMNNKGHWGGSDWAQVEGIQEFKRGDRVIGYFCYVKPVGFIVTSLRKELAPIKAYSTESNLDPESDEGLADLLKMKMEGILDAMEKPVRLFNTTKSYNVNNMLEIDYRPVWEELCGEVTSYVMNIQSNRIMMNYQEGEVLLSSNWDQRPPYNDQCPDMGCSPSYYNNNAHVGCGAVAIAQIMRYWAWPPNGMGSDDYVDYRDDYNWINMLDWYRWDGQNFTDGEGNICNQVQIDAVAELCHEAGRALDSVYSCDGTSSYFEDQDYVLINFFRYSIQIEPEERASYSSVIEWFNKIKANINENQPISYRITDHAIIVDGWEEDTTGMKCHINYGWADLVDSDPNWSGIEHSNTWYTLDPINWIHGADPNKEKMFVDIKPEPSMGNPLSGIYIKQHYPYRYFNQDAAGSDVIFESGQNLQFLPGVVVTCTDGYIRFEGFDFDNTRLFSIKGTETGGSLAGIKIHEGVIKLHTNGSIRFH